MWLNFSQFGGESIYFFYPVMLLSITALIIVLPIKILYYRSRLWLVYSVVCYTSSLCGFANGNSGVFYWLGFIPLNSETSTWETCSAP